MLLPQFKSGVEKSILSAQRPEDVNNELMSWVLQRDAIKKEEEKKKIFKECHNKRLPPSSGKMEEQKKNAKDTRDSSWENMPSGVFDQVDSNWPPQLQRLASKYRNTI